MVSFLGSDGRPSTKSLAQRALPVGLVAVVVNLAAAGVANLIAAKALVIPAGPGSKSSNPLTVAPIIISTIFGTVLGVIALVLSRRFLGQRAERVFAIVAAAFALATIATSATSSIPGSSKVTLALLHITSAVVLIVGLLAHRARK